MTTRPPCSLKRQDCLTGFQLAKTLSLSPSQLLIPTLDPTGPLCGVSAATSSSSMASSSPVQHHLSRFEQVFTTCPPILELLLLHLPTSSIFDLYHTSRHLRDFLRAYPLAFKNLSFRLLLGPPAQPSNGTDSPDIVEPKRPYALDLLLRFGLPSTSCLARLDLDNTSVSGTELHASVLSPGRATLQHLSVRGCKDVSIKYHILPFLHMQMSTPPELFGHKPLALKSLYTYRCRHHRRRPYLPQSLNRKDSDSQPTHQLIELCHRLAIWTDTAWCPSPGSRCHRRKEYFIGRGTMGADEVWVPFDRLWRSHNVIGAFKEPGTVATPLDRGVGRLWEDEEHGYGGEALGSAMGRSSEGKEVPTHLRASHRAFVEGYKCHQCGDQILERCEQCSIRMHCMGCRKTLCHSCAFDRPVRKRRARSQHAQAQDIGAALTSVLGSSGSASILTPRRNKRNEQHRRKDPFWWAPGAMRSPNLMREDLEGINDSSEDEENATTNLQATGPIQAPRLDMHWCCLKPSFSGGGGLQFVGTPCGDNVRASPLPQGLGFEDPDFTGLPAPPPHQQDTSPADAVSHSDDSSLGSLDSDHSELESSTTSVVVPARTASDFNILPYLESAIDPNHLSFQRYSSPRSLCTSCYNSPGWKIPCAACHFPICIEHDLKRLKARRCGFRRLCRERENIQQAQGYLGRGETVPRQIADAGIMTFLAKWRPIVAQMADGDRERQLRGKWSPGEDRPHSVEQPHDQRAEVPHPLLSKEELVLPDLSSLMGKGAFGPDSTDKQQPTADGASDGQGAALDQARARIFLSRSLSTSALPHTKSAFPPARPPSAADSTTSNPSKMSVSFLLNPAPSHVDSSGDESDVILPRSLASHSTPPWTGCGAYLCASPRLGGDPRPSCGARDAALYCHNCAVLVCPDCIARDAPCACKNCSAVFHCANCREHPRVRGACLRTDGDALAEMLAVTGVAGADGHAKGGAEDPGLVLDGVSDFWAGLEGLEGEQNEEPAEEPVEMDA